MGVCCLCGGANIGADSGAGAGLLDSSAIKQEEAFVLVPPELKALPAKLLPHFTGLRKGEADVVKTTADDGKRKCSAYAYDTASCFFFFFSYYFFVVF